MAYMFLPKGSILAFINPAIPATRNYLTEHNRGALNVDVERIEKTHRMANGIMRKYVIADKRTFTVSWENIPHIASKTVDGKWAGGEIENWYNTYIGPFIVEVSTQTSLSQYTVMFTNFSKSIQKRGVYDFWNLDITLEEV